MRRTRGFLRLWNSENSKANRIETMTIGIEAIPCFSE
jgi:hypothetical protein